MTVTAIASMKTIIEVIDVKNDGFIKWRLVNKKAGVTDKPPINHILHIHFISVVHSKICLIFSPRVHEVINPFFPYEKKKMPHHVRLFVILLVHYSITNAISPELRRAQSRNSNRISSLQKWLHIFIFQRKREPSCPYPFRKLFRHNRTRFSISFQNRVTPLENLLVSEFFATIIGIHTRRTISRAIRILFLVVWHDCSDSVYRNTRHFGKTRFESCPKSIGRCSVYGYYIDIHIKLFMRSTLDHSRKLSQYLVVLFHHLIPHFQSPVIVISPFRPLLLVHPCKIGDIVGDSYKSQSRESRNFQNLHEYRVHTRKVLRDGKRNRHLQ